MEQARSERSFSRQQTADSRQQTADSRQQTADSRQQRSATASCRFHATSLFLGEMYRYMYLRRGRVQAPFTVFFYFQKMRDQRSVYLHQIGFK
jgi:hypothetical protein